MGKEGKIIWLIGLVTVAIIGVGVYFLSKPPASQTGSGNKVDQSILIREDSAVKKAPGEKAVLVEFGDFQCPACALYAPIISQIAKDFENELTLVFRHFPLSQHKNALPSSFAVEAAGRQGKFWEMVDVVYKNQNEWSVSSKPNDYFDKYAKELGLNLEKFKTDSDSKEVRDKVQSDYADGALLGVNSTPTFYLNGEKIRAPRSLDEFKSIIASAISNSPLDVSDEEADVYHAHFDLGIVINGKSLDLSQKKYQSEEGAELNEWIHLHDGNGKVVHIHKKGTELSDLFNSLKIILNDECLTLDTGEKYCTGNGRTLRMFVNGDESTEFESYEPKDLDRILITYGSESSDALKKQVDSVSSDACIYSKTCPERGSPPDEECVGGLGTGCEEE